MRTLWFLAAPFVVLAPQAAMAQRNNCADALIQDKGKFKSNDSASYALYRLVHGSSSRTTDEGANVAVPIEGVPVKFGYTNKDKDTSDYFDQSDVNWTYERLVSAATQTLSQNAVEAYKACIGAKRPVQIIVSDARADSITVTVKFVAPVPPQPGSVSIRGATFDQAFPRIWRSGEERSVTVTRNPRRDARIVANIGGYSAAELIAYLPPAKPRAPEAPPVLTETPLYAGRTPNLNAYEISPYPQHKNGATVAYGYTIKAGPDAGPALYVGLTANVSAGIVNTAGGGWRGGVTAPIGYVIKPGRQKPGDLPLFAGNVPGSCEGLVSDVLNYPGCSMVLIGFAKKDK